MNWNLVKHINAQLGNCRRNGHVHTWPEMMSRRRFARTAAGAAIGAGIGLPRLLQAEPKKSSVPNPIPGGTPVLGGGFHVFGPAAIDPANAEPATITDFKGFVGLAYIDGSVKRTNRHTGEVRVLPMMGSDMRFMSGVYKGVDGRIYEGAFALV